MPEGTGRNSILAHFGGSLAACAGIAASAHAKPAAATRTAPADFIKFPLAKTIRSGPNRPHWVPNPIPRLAPVLVQPRRGSRKSSRATLLIINRALAILRPFGTRTWMRRLFAALAISLLAGCAAGP